MPNLNPILMAMLIGLGSAVNIIVSKSAGITTSPLQYGLMFEDINHSGDGGIYAELVQNRAFQGSAMIPSTIAPWTPIGASRLVLQNTSVALSHALPTSVHVVATEKTIKSAQIGIKNPGWWGIDVKQQTYKGSFWTTGAYNGKFVASLESALTKDVWATVEISGKSQTEKWTEHTFELHPRRVAPNSNNTFSLSWDSEADLNLNLISLFPPTYNNRPNGMRIDLMEDLKALNPSFLRIPGGNNMEGQMPPYKWFWNATLGPLKDRPGRPGTWGYENTDGLGLIEYLQWCDDLEVEPIWAVWSGLYLNGSFLSEEELKPHVQDALNELEFITGDKNSPFGSLRAHLGYPKPWKINIVEVGNEDNLWNGTISYNSYRFSMFYNAIHAKYPHMTILASFPNSPPTWQGGPSAPTPGQSGGDYHQYTRPDEFASEFHIFDNYSTEHVTLVGEYAHIQNNEVGQVSTNWSAARIKYPTWIGAVAEAIFELGIERNTDKIMGASYAPGFQNLNSYEWGPDLIAFTADPAQTVLSTSYHQIKLFSNARTTLTLPSTSDSPAGPAFWSTGMNANTKQYILKAAVYNTTIPVPFIVDFGSAGKTGKLTVLTGESGLAQNVLGGKEVVKTEVRNLKNIGGKWKFELPQWSVAALIVDM